MNTTTIIIVVVAVVGIIVLLAGGGIVYYILLNKSDEEDDESSEKKPVKVKGKKKPIVKPSDDDESEDDEIDEEDEDTEEEEEKKPAKSTKLSSMPSSAPKPLETATDKPTEEDSNKIRILIVDDNPDTRDNVSRLLYFEKDMEVIGQAVNGRQGIEMALSLKPHIVLMDINMPDMDGITATSKLSALSQFSQVIIISVQAEPHYMRQAMAAGARDFQPKPFTVDELVSCIRRVYQVALPTYKQIEAMERSKVLEQAAEVKQAKIDASVFSPPIIVVYGPKGGVGTSTIAVNLAVALQQLHGETVLMDANLQFGDVSVHLNTRPNRAISNLIHDGEADIELLPDLLMSHNSGLKLLLAPPTPELADEISPEIVTEALGRLQKMFKIVIADTNRNLNDKTLAAIEKADYILVVTSPELPAIKNAKAFMELAERLELNLDHIQVVINRSTLPGGVRVEQIQKALKLEHAYQIPYDPRIYTATGKGVTVIQQDASAPSAKAIISIAQELWLKINSNTTT